MLNGIPRRRSDDGLQTSKWITLGFGALCLVLVAGALRQPHLYYMAAILLTLPAVSYLLGWQALRGLRFERDLPGMAWEGEEGQITYLAHNDTKIARFFLSIHEAFPSWIAPLDSEGALFNVDAETDTRVVSRVRFQRRGVYAVDGFEVTAMDPLGVFAFSKRFANNGELVVFPTPHDVSTLPLTGSERYGWQEWTTAAFRGNSVDPNGVRAYVPGDALRRVHWRQTARTGKLSVIEFEEAQSVQLIIALDLLHGTDVRKGDASTLETAVRLAASTAHQAIQSGASVRLMLSPTMTAAMDGHPGAGAGEAARGQEHLFVLLDALARVQAQAVETISDVIDREAVELGSGSTLLVITSHADNALPDVLLQCAARQVNAGVIWIDPAAYRSRMEADAGRGLKFLTALQAARAQTFVHTPGGSEEIGTVSQLHAYAN